jgi:hypothetical protein
MLDGTIPSARANESMTSHSSRASPGGGTTASECWTNGVV